MNSPNHLGTTSPHQDSTTASPWVPLWRIIEQIASAIGDCSEAEHYTKTRLYIRQAAAEGRLRVRGRHEIEVAGQDRTIFSEIYTEIPSDYWKTSVINVLAIGAAFEADRLTEPEKTPYAWGPKGLYEPNCYTGLQLHSDEVSQVIRDARGAGLLADVQIPEEEEWISAASALALLDLNFGIGERAICKRAHAGLVKARAERLIRDGQSVDNIDIPDDFWWAEGEAALEQDWETDYFETWIDHRVRLQAFGVRFRRSDIERVKNASAPNRTDIALMKILEERQTMSATVKNVFIGHGRSLIWYQLKDFLQNSLHLSIDEFNNISAAGTSTVARLEEMLATAAFALLVMTAEDERPDGKCNPRLNVVHEAGLFQGKLGFEKAIILREEGCEEFSNIHGLIQIPFPTGNIEACYEKIRGVLEREGLLAVSRPADSNPPERKSRFPYTRPRNAR